LKELKCDLYQSEKRMVKKTRRQRTLEEYFKIRARAFHHVFCYARFCYARSTRLRPFNSATPVRLGYARSTRLRPLVVGRLRHSASALIFCAPSQHVATYFASHVHFLSTIITLIFCTPSQHVLRHTMHFPRAPPS
jgi:hypothetical protein